MTTAVGIGKYTTIKKVRKFTWEKKAAYKGELLTKTGGGPAPVRGQIRVGWRIAHQRPSLQESRQAF
jgi:hypothetical protein